MTEIARELETCGAIGCMHGCMIIAYVNAWIEARTNEDDSAAIIFKDISHAMELGRKSGCLQVDGLQQQIDDVLG